MRKKRLKTLAALLLGMLLLFGVVIPAYPEGAGTCTKYFDMFYDTFDTVATLIGYTESEEVFREVFNETRNMMTRYHQVFDGYNAYEGLNNLYVVNRDAGKGPVLAEPELIDLLLWVREALQDLPPRVNIAMGAVLSVWHDYRTEGVTLPPMDLLRERNGHVNPEDLIIDPEAGTVFFADPELSLDLGAVAKGYATEMVATRLLEKEMPSYILNMGGNVRCGGKPMDGRERWGVGIQDPGDKKSPLPSTYLDVLYTRECSVVTSGDYQRYYEVNGERYHHIIDPDTLMPSQYIRSITVLTADSGLADLLSTTLFLLSYEDGRALVDSLDGVEAYWVLNDGSLQWTDGMGGRLQSQGATAR